MSRVRGQGERGKEDFCRRIRQSPRVRAFFVGERECEGKRDSHLQLGNLEARPRVFVLSSFQRLRAQRVHRCCTLLFKS